MALRPWKATRSAGGIAQSVRRGVPFGRGLKGALAVLRLLVWGPSQTASSRLAITLFRLLWASGTCSEVP